MRYLVALALLFATAVFAADTPTTTTLYKSVGPDGKIVYADRPPGAGQTAKALTFENMPATPLSATTLAYIEELGKSKPPPSAARSSNEAILFTTAWCGYCRQARAYLASKGVAYRDVDIETKHGLVEYVRAGGTKGVPLLVANKKRVLGFSTAGYDSLFSKAK